MRTACALILTMLLSLIASAQRKEPSAPAVVLQSLLDDRNYVELVRRMPETTGLTPEEAQYFKGILAYRQGHFQDAFRPLVDAVNTREYSLTSFQVENAIETLGDAAAKTFQYQRAIQYYNNVEEIFGARMGPAFEPVREKRAIAVALQKLPAQKLQLTGDVLLKREGIQYPVSAGGKNFFAVLDTGAAYSVLKESTAKKLGITPMEDTVTFHGYSGNSFPAHPASIPNLLIGKAEFHHVAVFITTDNNLLLGDAILGYPVVSALGRLTFAKDGTLTVHADLPATLASDEAPLWVGDSWLLVTLNTATGGKDPRLFVLDTGSLSTFLTDHYLAEHKGSFPGSPNDTAILAGAGGVNSIPAYSAKRLPLWAGATQFLLDGQHVLAQSQGGEAESFHGLIGQDVLRGFSSYTIDFRAMRFSVTP